MPSTSNYGFPYPALTDPPDGAGQLGALANAVDEELADAQTANRQARQLLVPYATAQSLSDPPTPSEATYRTWGSSLVISGYTGTSVTVMAWGTGMATNDGDGTQHRMRVGISTNGGSSFDWGIPAVDQAGGGARTRRCGFSPFAVAANVEPTSSIVVRAEAWWSAGGGDASPDFSNGHLAALVIPQG